MELRSLNEIRSDIYATSQDIWQDLRNTNALRLYRFYTMKGLNVIVEVAIPILKMVNDFCSDTVENALTAARDFRDLYQMSCFFPSFYRFTKEINVKRALQAVENLSYTSSFLYKYEICSFTSWQEGVEKIEKARFFQFSLSRNLLKVPRDFFTLVHSVYDVCTLSRKYIYKSIPETNDNLLEEIKIQKRMDLLLFTRRVGQISIILFRNLQASRLITSPWGRLTVSVLEFSTAVVHLVRVLLKN